MPARRLEYFGDPLGSYQLVLGDEVVGSFQALVEDGPESRNAPQLTLKRGTLISDDLVRWREAFVAGRGVRRSGRVVRTQPGGGTVAKWLFTNAVPVTVRATSGSLVVSEVVIAVEKVEHG